MLDVEVTCCEVQAEATSAVALVSSTTSLFAFDDKNVWAFSSSSSSLWSSGLSKVLSGRLRCAAAVGVHLLLVEEGRFVLLEKKAVWTVRARVGLPYFANGCALSVDENGDYLVFLCGACGLQVHELRRGMHKAKWRLKKHSIALACIALPLVVVATLDGHVGVISHAAKKNQKKQWLWFSQEGERVTQLEMSTGGAYCVALCRNGSGIVISLENQSVVYSFAPSQLMLVKELDPLGWPATCMWQRSNDNLLLLHVACQDVLKSYCIEGNATLLKSTTRVDVPILALSSSSHDGNMYALSEQSKFLQLQIKLSVI